MNSIYSKVREYYNTLKLADARRIIDFCEDWKYTDEHGKENCAWHKVSLPHDYSVRQGYFMNARSGLTGGYVKTGIVVYQKEFMAGELRGTVQRLTHKTIDSNFSVFVAGLGNIDLTPDAIGPQTMKRLTATRHLRQYEKELYHAAGCSSLSAFSPGVLGQTGVETSELLRGAVNATHPDVIIVIDALTARSCDRLCATVQLSDTGIEPGSGVGNHRRAITYKSMGVPVVALGVPTVVNSATLVWDALQEAGIDGKDPQLQKVLENGKSFFVSPKESDLICESVAQLFARAIGFAFTEGLMDAE